ncbi:hypothetical protein [Kitasatospora griseola]|uniref:hypothetical protein n=1 Tax=Kitasatospora griseola TaxID=2064 RepID=UPI00342C98A3
MSDTSTVRKVMMKRLRIPALALGVIALGSTLAFAQGGHESATAGKAAQAAVTYQYVMGDAVTLPAGQEGGADVSCPEGQVPTGGGMGSTLTGNVNLSYMYAVGREWIVRAKNWGGQPEALAAFAVCAPGTSVGPNLQNGMPLLGKG